MARIRSIKPEVHTDEDLWDAEQETGLPLFRAFTALWGQADREGRFKWRARTLKTGCLPYWDGDFSRVLDALTTRGFLVRYTSDSREYGLIRTFKQHQVINGRESASSLPAPPEPSTTTDTSTRAPRVDDACPTRPVHAHGEGKGREGKGKEGEGASRSRADLFCDLFREVFDTTSPPKISEQWDHTERTACVKGALWCRDEAGDDWANVRAELERLRCDDWLARQPIHTVVKRLGTGKGKATGPAKAPTNVNYSEASTEL